MPCAAYFTASLRSASSKMMFAPLPPSSSVTFFRFDLDAASMTFRPTGVDPVNATLSTRGLVARALPTVGP
jgi:hypothetical protein